MNIDKRIDKLNLYYYDPDELGADAFIKLGDDEKAEVKQLISDVLDEVTPERTDASYTKGTPHVLGGGGVEVDHAAVEQNKCADRFEEKRRKLGL